VCVQNLRKTVEKEKADDHLNEESLQYQFVWLKKKEEENSNSKIQMKRKIIRY